MILFYCSITLSVIALLSTALANPTTVEKSEEYEFNNYSTESNPS